MATVYGEHVLPPLQDPFSVVMRYLAAAAGYATGGVGFVLSVTVFEDTTQTTTVIWMRVISLALGVVAMVSATVAVAAMQYERHLLRKRRAQSQETGAAALADAWQGLADLDRVAEAIGAGEAQLAERRRQLAHIERAQGELWREHSGLTDRFADPASQPDRAERQAQHRAGEPVASRGDGLDG